MNMKFANDVTVEIQGLVEQRVGSGEIRWIMMFSILTQLTTEGLEELLTEENISVLEITDGETTKVIEGYNKVAVATMRYMSDLQTIIEVQLRR